MSTDADILAAIRYIRDTPYEVRSYRSAVEEHQDRGILIGDLLDDTTRKSPGNLWKAITRDRSRPFRDYLAAARRMFRSQAETTIAAVAASSSVAGISRELIFNLDEMSELALEHLSPAHASAIKAGFKFIDLTFEYGGTYQVEGSRLAIAKMNRKIVGIQEHTADRLDRVILKANENGLSVRETADQVAELFEDMTAGRALRIAQTGTTAGFNAGEVQAIDAAGKVSTWLSQRDGDIRPAHEAADGAEREPGGTFDVDGEALEYPGDPAGSPGNVINCRCAVLPKGDK